MNYIFDFDSTLIKQESLDKLILSMSSQNIKEKISDITNKGINNEISFTESLQKRINILTKFDITIDDIIRFAKTSITLSKSIKQNINFFKKNQNNIYIISGGFSKVIKPVAEKLFIHESHVFANNFTFKNNIITDFNTNNLASKDNGKSQIIENLNLQHPIVMIGDGFSDYKTKQSGQVDYFIAYTENIAREKTLQYSKYIAKNFTELQEIIKTLNF